MIMDVFGGDMFRGATEALVNPVNCVGVMGKGLALEFNKRFPQSCELYKAAAKAGKVIPGKLVVEPIQEVTFVGLRFIIHFPTKRHWRNKSKLGDIELGLWSLGKCVFDNKIKSISIPPLGCGEGGLNWGSVYSLIINQFKNADAVIQIYNPPGWRR